MKNFIVCICLTDASRGGRDDTLQKNGKALSFDTIEEAQAAGLEILEREYGCKGDAMQVIDI